MNAFATPKWEDWRGDQNQGDGADLEAKEIDDWQPQASIRLARLLKIDTAAAQPTSTAFASTPVTPGRESLIHQTLGPGNMDGSGSAVNRTVRSKPRSSTSLSCFPSPFRSRTTKLFGAGDKFLYDWPSTSLEAFAMEDSNITKLPFGHKRLEYGLGRVLDVGRATPWSTYAHATPGQRTDMEQMTGFARRSSHHKRSLLAFHQVQTAGSSTLALAFFSVHELQPPVSFSDGKGRRFMIPYEVCRREEVSSKIKCELAT